MSITFQTEEATTARRIGEPEVVLDRNHQNLIDSTDLEAITVDVLEKVLAHTGKLCTEQFGTPTAPDTHRRWPKKPPSGIQGYAECGNWILDDVLGKVLRGQWANMVADTIVEHIERVRQAQPNGVWRLESVQPMKRTVKENLPVSAPDKNGTETFDPEARTPKPNQRTLTKLVLRCVFVDLNGSGWIVRKDGVDIDGTEIDAGQQAATIAASMAPAMATAMVDALAKREAATAPAAPAEPKPLNVTPLGPVKK